MSDWKHPKPVPIGLFVPYAEKSKKGKKNKVIIIIISSGVLHLFMACTKTTHANILYDKWQGSWKIDKKLNFRVVCLICFLILTIKSSKLIELSV